jgi:hypothetical protein
MRPVGLALACFLVALTSVPSASAITDKLDVAVSPGGPCQSGLDQDCYQGGNYCDYYYGDGNTDHVCVMLDHEKGLCHHAPDLCNV